MNRSLLIVVGVWIGGLPAWTGCTTVAKQAFYELRGAKAEVVLNSEPADVDLEPYVAVEFAPATTTLSDRLCPREVIAAYDRHARALTRDLLEAYPGGEPRLVLDSEVLFFQSKGIMSQAQMLTRVRMRDGERLVADAIIKCESKAFREGGGKELAETSVKGLAKWLRKQKGIEDEDNDKDNEKDKKSKGGARRG
jgi:hypothetical protein